MRFARAATLLAATALVLTGCGTTEDSTADLGQREPGEQPVQVTDARGKKVTLPAPADNVVALEWAEAEALVTLGVQPAGVADVEGYDQWVTAAPLADSVDDVGVRGEPSVDSIAKLEPDLVITETDRPDALVSKLEQYDVPVMVLEGSDTTDNIGQMKQNFSTIATAVGKEAEARQILGEFEQTVDDARQRLAQAGLDGRRFMMADGWMEGSSVAIRPFGEGSLMSDVAEAIGLENAWKGKVDSTWGLGQTDVEGLTNVGDVEFFYNAQNEDDVFADGLEGNAIWDSLPFVKQDNVHKLTEGTWTFGGPRSTTQFIESVTKALM